MTDTRRKAKNEIVPSRTITAASSQGTYIPNWIPVRQGSQDHERYPSRQADTLVYRDGRREPA